MNSPQECLVVIYFRATKTASSRAQIQYIPEAPYIISAKGKQTFRTVQKYRDQLHDSRRSSFPSISAFQPTVVKAASNLKVRRFNRGLSYGTASNLWKPSVLMDL